MKNGTQWPWIIGAFLVGNVIAMVLLVMFSSGAGAPQVIDDYYVKALNHDQAMEKERASQILGWSVAIEFSQETADSASLSATITDRDRTPISGAQVTIEMYHRAHATEVVSGTLTAGENGAYLGSFPAKRPGLWDVKLTVTRGKDVFFTTKTVTLTGPAPMNSAPSNTAETGQGTP